MKSFLPAVALSLGAATAALAQTDGAEGPGRTIIVLDASGSMWGAIDGRPKLEIARETVARVLEGIDPARELGLMAYGHRRRGDCADIELIVPPAPGTAAAIIAATAEMRFQGRTPLTDAVRAAAQALNYTEDRATVVLITDGVETCEADPCALARELEAAGIGFTAHVVGFGLTAEEGAQVSCLAEETGGVYAAAADAETLLAALTATVAAPEPVPEEPALATGPWFEGAPLMADVAIAPTGRTLPGRAAVPVAAFDFPADGDAALCQAICADDTACHAWRHEPPGSLFVAEARCFAFDDAAEFVWAAEPGFSSGMRAGHLALTTAYAPAVAAQFRLTAPDQVMAGTAISVEWATTDYMQGDQIDLSPPGNDAIRGYLSRTGLNVNGAAVTLNTPGDAGPFELRYIRPSGEGAGVLARRTITLTPLTASLQAPDQVAPGESFSVAWDGPFASVHWVTLVPPGAAEGAYDHGYFYLDASGAPGRLTAPEAPGTYELRYVLSGAGPYRVVHRRAITVAAPGTAAVTPPAPAEAGGEWTLSAAATAMAGEGLVVTWTGPRYTAGDYIDIAPPGLAGPEGYVSWAYTDEARGPVTLVLPPQPGSYEIRYVEATQPVATVRARQTVTLSPLVASLTAPDRVAPGEAFAVAWEGPFNASYWVTLVPPQAAPGAFDHGYFYLSEDRAPGQLTAPEAPGTYEVRYVLDRGGSYLVAARRTITVAPAPEPAPVTPPLRK